jgi:ssRNA-specific RNase YbeY (16S rRNA maturation enzyme)
MNTLTIWLSLKLDCTHFEIIKVPPKDTEETSKSLSQKLLEIDTQTKELSRYLLESEDAESLHKRLYDDDSIKKVLSFGELTSQEYKDFFATETFSASEASKMKCEQYIGKSALATQTTYLLETLLILIKKIRSLSKDADDSSETLTLDEIQDFPPTLTLLFKETFVGQIALCTMINGHTFPELQSHTEKFHSSLLEHIHRGMFSHIKMLSLFKDEFPPSAVKIPGNIFSITEQRKLLQKISKE